MTEQDLWIRFLSAGISSNALESLGHDLYFARAPQRATLSALKGLTTSLETHPAVIWRALNIDPGRDTLERLAADYKARKPWSTTAPSTRAYVTKVVNKISAQAPPYIPPGAIPPDAGPQIHVSSASRIQAARARFAT